MGPIPRSPNFLPGLSLCTQTQECLGYSKLGLGAWPPHALGWPCALQLLHSYGWTAKQSGRDEGLDVSPRDTALSSRHRPATSVGTEGPDRHPLLQFPSLDLVAHTGATQARVDIFRERYF